MISSLAFPSQSHFLMRPHPKFLQSAVGAGGDTGPGGAADHQPRHAALLRAARAPHLRPPAVEPALRGRRRGPRLQVPCAPLELWRLSGMSSDAPVTPQPPAGQRPNSRVGKALHKTTPLLLDLQLRAGLMHAWREAPAILGDAHTGTALHSAAAGACSAATRRWCCAACAASAPGSTTCTPPLSSPPPPSPTRSSTSRTCWVGAHNRSAVRVLHRRVSA